MIKDEEKVHKIKQLLKFHPRGLSISDIAQKLKTNRNSLAKYLDILLITGQVEMRTYGVAKVYHLSSRVPLSAMMKFAEELIIVLDDQMTVVQANDRFLEFFGFSRDDLIGTSFSERSLPPFSDTNLLQYLLDARETTEPGKKIETEINVEKTQFKVKFVPLVFDDGSHGTTIFFEDVTQQKEYERQLRESEEKYRVLVESSRDGIIIIDLNGIIAFANTTAAKMYDQDSPESVVGMSVLDIVTPEFRERVKNNIQKVHSGTRDFYSTYKFITPNGREVWIESSSAKIIYKGETALIMTIRDITARKEAERELMIKNSAIEASLTGIAIMDLEKKFIYCNPAIVSLFDFESPGEVMGKTLSQLTMENNNLAAVFGSAEAEIAQTGRWADEIQFKKKDETILHLLASANVVKNETGDPLFSMISVADITRQRMAEEQYRSTYGKLKDTIEFMPDPTFIVNRYKQVVAWNKAMELLTGIKKETVLNTRDYPKAFPFLSGIRPPLVDLLDLSPHDLAVKYPTIRKIGTNVFSEALVPSLYGGKDAHLWEKANPLFDKDGNKIGAIESIRDISEWRQAEEFMRKAYER